MQRLRLPLAALVMIAPGCAPAPSAAPPSNPHGAAHAHGHSEKHAHGHGDGPLVHRFENAEDWAKDFDDPTRDAWQKPAEVVLVVGVANGMTVADVGAGTGYFLPHLSRAVGGAGRVIALDIEPDMVRYMSERAAKEGLTNVEARLAAGDDPKLDLGSVDRILIVDTWHHIPERKAYAQKLAAALRAGGAVAVVDFTKEATHGPPAQHRISPETVMAELEAGGLAASIAPETLPEQYIVIGAKR